MRLLVLTVLAALILAGPAPAAWRSPVPGAVTRSFDLGRNPFEAGRHRGVDLAAPPGTAVRSPCAGRVAFAGAVGSSGRVVTVLCGHWRVTQMPLASVAVRTGATVGEGEPLGTLAASREHAGLHLGVRRDGTRFGYTDPLRFLAPGRPATAPPVGPAPRRARPPRPAPPRPPAPRPPAPRPRPLVAPPRLLIAPQPALAPTRSNRGPRAPLAPWPAWLGLALALGGAGVRVRARSRRARAPAAAAGTLVPSD
jgi:Peptidase family M23